MPSRKLINNINSKPMGSKNSLVVAKDNISEFGNVKKYSSVDLEKDMQDIRVVQGKKRSDFLHNLYNKYSEKEITERIAKKYNLETIDLSSFKPDRKVVIKISKKLCKKYSVIPVSQIEDTIVVAFADPGDMQAKEDIGLVVNATIESVVAGRKQIQAMIDIYHENQNESRMKHISNLMELSGEEKVVSDKDFFDKDVKHDPIVQLVDSFIERGVELRCSDIHVEVYETACRVRFRIDGTLSESVSIPIQKAPLILSRIKMISALDISEKRLPQDGRLTRMIKNKKVSFRVSTVPVTGGEKVVLRILDTSALGTNLEELGMNTRQLNIFRKYLNMSQGLILMTGPTGSGKTTTIYSGLQLLNEPSRNISTVEDPIEYKIHGINQVQIHATIGLSFSLVLKAFLRQDPDVILVGEIRDIETTNMAYRAAATGHLVLSTLHTNDTTSTITRLMDMGLPAYSVSENTSVIVAQRLLRVLCEQCKEPANITADILKNIGCLPKNIDKIQPFVMQKNKKGDCSYCNGIGYRGRIAVFEVLELTENLKEGIVKELPPIELKKIAITQNNLQTLRQNALEKLGQGVVSVEEVLYGTIGDAL